jgi:hypothetical protein
MPKNIYDKKALIELDSERESYAWETISPNPQIVEKIIKEICSSGEYGRQLIYDILFKPKEINFEKLFIDINYGKINFIRPRCEFKIINKLYTGDVYDIEGERSLEVIDQENRWKILIRFYVPVASTKIRNEIHILCTTGGIWGYIHHIKIYNNRVFNADIGSSYMDWDSIKLL